MFEAHNLASAGGSAELLRQAKEHQADAISHLAGGHPARRAPRRTPGKFIEAAKAAGMHGKVVCALLGGPRIDHKLALELGFDTPDSVAGTKPSDVANYIYGHLRSGYAGPHMIGDKATLRIRLFPRTSAYYGGGLVDGARVHRSLRRHIGHRGFLLRH